MIIVSQDKKVLINIETTLGIQIEEHIKNNDGEKDYEVKVITERRTCTIGIFDTEKRAKEILQEIISKYRQWNKDANNAVTIIPKVYEMPEE